MGDVRKDKVKERKAQEYKNEERDKNSKCQGGDHGKQEISREKREARQSIEETFEEIEGSVVSASGISRKVKIDGVTEVCMNSENSYGNLEKIPGKRQVVESDFSGETIKCELNENKSVNLKTPKQGTSDKNYMEVYDKLGMRNKDDPNSIDLLAGEVESE